MPQGSHFLGLTVWTQLTPGLLQLGHMRIQAQKDLTMKTFLLTMPDENTLHLLVHYHNGKPLTSNKLVAQ